MNAQYSGYSTSTSSCLALMKLHSLVLRKARRAKWFKVGINLSKIRRDLIENNKDDIIRFLLSQQ